MGTRDCYPRVKRQELEADHLHLMPRLRMLEVYLRSPIRLPGVVHREKFAFTVGFEEVLTAVTKE
jgi:hypothetical protein